MTNLLLLGLSDQVFKHIDLQVAPIFSGPRSVSFNAHGSKTAAVTLAYTLFTLLLSLLFVHAHAAIYMQLATNKEAQGAKKAHLKRFSRSWGRSMNSGRTQNESSNMASRMHQFRFHSSVLVNMKCFRIPGTDTCSASTPCTSNKYAYLVDISQAQRCSIWP